jgi:hypothetical protein
MQPADVQAKWDEYRRQCDEHVATVRYRDKLLQVPQKIIYTLEGFCLLLDMSEEELKKYEDNKNYKAVFKKIRYQVMCRKMHALVNGEGNARALIYDLKVNHGIDPKQARQDEDWIITMDLNDGRGPVVVDGPGKKKSRKAGKRALPAQVNETGYEQPATPAEDRWREEGTGGTGEPGGELLETTGNGREAIQQESPPGYGTISLNPQPKPANKQQEPPGLGYGKYSVW